MEDNFKPKKYPSLSPYFVCDDPESFENFLREVFDANPLRKYKGEDQKIVHAEMRIFDSVVMYSNSNGWYPSNSQLVNVYLPDVDATFQKAMDFGCEKIDEPVQHPGDPDKRGNFKDPWGNIWSVATQMNNE